MKHFALLSCCLLSLHAASSGCKSLLGDKVAESKMPNETAPSPDVHPAAPTPRIHQGTHIAAGQMLERQGDYAGAIEQYEKAITSNPRVPTGYNRLGIIYQKLGRYADADLIYRQGIKANPESAILHNNHGYNHLLQTQFDEAEKCFRYALTLNPEFNRARMNLGIVLAHLKRLRESAEEFSRVVSPDVAHFNVAAVCMQRGDYVQSEKSLNQALSINPDCPGAREQLQKVTRLAASKSAPDPTPPVPTPLAGRAEQAGADTP